MRIAIATRFLLQNKLEGMGWFTYEVVKRMTEQHPEYEFILFFDRPYGDAFSFSENVTTVIVPPQSRHPILWYIWFEIQIPRMVKKHQADVFISPDNFMSLSLKVPTILVTHDLAHVHFPDAIPLLAKKYYQWNIEKFHQKATSVISVSKYTKQDIIKQYKISSEKIAVACNGCREGFQSLLLPEIEQIRAEYAQSKPYFLYVGAIHPRKNVHRLIQAFDAFKEKTESDMQLLIIGRFSWQTGPVKDAYDQAQYQEDINFLGYVSEELLYKLMASAYALTYISLFEGFGIPLLEAMHCNVPVITSNVSSMPEVVGDAGITVDPLDTNAITQAMEQLWQNPDLRTSLIEKGATQKTKFSWQIATDVIWREVMEVTRNN